MGVGLQVLPLAITMMAGPQIMSAIVLVTTGRAVRVSLAFLSGILLATAAGVAIARELAGLLGSALHAGGPHSSGFGKAIQIGLIVLLALLALKNYLGRKTAQPPKWLGTLLSASPATGFKTGLLVILSMPSDVLIMLTVGANLEHHNAGFGAALPFLAATLLVAALPLLLYLAFHRKAVRAMPAVRDWMNTHSWLVNIIVCAIFITLVATGA
ncbi:GAP family protein [Saccharopolyspora flava]|uniref:Sap, sulfolipid-1-addressing protein n=1 Tax=Saccharopolyspora flava TaxID=95161 RepID=A0A1I6UDY9_9PSEU|nr:GAP family protein [Saccharopolyspora flava]SFS99611.1 Sap, sulfolipid-1-addressing protein [Saccharopolyspora flava]